MPLARVERGEDLGGHRVGDDRVRGTQPLGRGHRVGGRADRAGGEHHRTAPALRALAHDGDDPGVGRAGVLGDQHRRLLLLEPQQLAAQDRQVAAQLRAEPGDAEVPARQQQHPHPVGLVVDQPVEHLDRRRGQQVGVVEHQQPGRHPGVLVAGGVDQAEQRLGAEVGPGLDPVHPVEASVTEPAADPERLAGTDRADQHGERALGARVEPLPEARPGDVDPRQPRQVVEVWRRGQKGLRRGCHTVLRSGIARQAHACPEICLGRANSSRSSPAALRRLGTDEGAAPHPLRVRRRASPSGPWMASHAPESPRRVASAQITTMSRKMMSIDQNG